MESRSKTTELAAPPPRLPEAHKRSQPCPQGPLPRGGSGCPRPASSGPSPFLRPQVTFTDVGLTARDDDGATVLHFAARGGHTPILDRLLLMGAPIMRDSWGGDPLHDAAENGQMEVRRWGMGVGRGASESWQSWTTSCE